MDTGAAPNLPESRSGTAIQRQTDPAARPRVGLRRHWPIPASLLLLLSIAAFAWWSLSGNNSVRYTTVPASHGAITRAVAATGTVNPELTIIVGTYVSGVIKQLFCDYNTEVKEGQICAKIDPAPYETVVEQSKANLSVAKAQLEKDRAALAYAKITNERYSRLVKQDSVSRDAADNARNAYEQALAQIEFDQATIQQRQAALDAAQVNLDYTDITSPVDGTVVSRNVTQGQTVAASFQTPTLFLIATDLTRMQVDTNVSESDIGGIELNDLATFNVDAFPRRVFEGKVTQVRQSPQTVQNVVTYDVVVTVDNDDLSLKPGMTASTRIITDQRTDVLRVPNQALRYMPAAAGPRRAGEPGKGQLWVLRDGKPEPVAVTTGLDDDSYTEITGGDLKPGDAVVTAEQAANNKAAAPRLRF